jgi:hypothetical protein
MSRKFLTSIDLTKNELQNAVIQNLASAPSSPVAGQVYYDTVEKQLYVYNGSAWNQSTGIETGTLSSRPSAGAATSGVFYYATDNFLMYYSNGSTWQQIDAFGSGASTTVAIAGTAADGSSTNYARADHTHAGPGFGSSTSTTTYGLAKADGTATTVAHSDHTHGTPALSTNAATNISTTTAANGSGTAPAKDDHVHGFAPSGFALSAFGLPTSAVAFNSQKITGLADPTNPQDAATKNYVDSTAQGLDVKQSVRAATAAAGTLASSFANGSVIDTNVTLVTGDRILIKDQASGADNGIYTVNASGAPTRAIDANVNADVTAGMFVFVAEGTKNADTGWVLTTNDPITLGSTALTFAQFSGAGTYTASNGVTLSGSNFVFTPTTTGGLQTGSTGASIKLPTPSGLTADSAGLYVTAGLGITISGAGAAGAATTNQVAINTDTVVRKYATAIGDGILTQIPVTHNLNTRDVTVGVYLATSTYDEVECDVQRTSASTVTLLFSVAPTTGQYRVVVHG